MMFDDILEKMALVGLAAASLLALTALGCGIYYYCKWMMDE